MHLSLDLIRSIVTVSLFVLFIVLCAWAWSSRRRDEFDAAARLIFDDSESATLQRTHQPEESR
jgi:cytochrome c oxidase cbb3-type subunit 4